MVAKIQEKEVSAAAAMLGKRGGEARAEKLSPRRRRQIALKGVRVRLKKKKEEQNGREA